MTTPPKTANRFPVGTFAPAPQAAPIYRMLLAQSLLELRLILRHGEQLLLTLFIPITLLIGLCLLPIGDIGESKPGLFVPAIMTVAVMSTAFTGQAIAVGFDRRYGALKRLGATPLPRWGLIVGKQIAVVIVVILQALIIGAIGLALGWRPDVVGLLIGAVAIAVGTFTFAALGLLLGGTLKAEIVLALANLLWFAMIGIGSLAVMGHRVPAAAHWVARSVPSGALSEALHRATAGGSVDWYGFAILLVWGALGSAAAVRYFRFS